MTKRPTNGTVYLGKQENSFEAIHEQCQKEINTLLEELYDLKHE